MCAGSFYPPTVLADVPEDALVAQEEVFGPLMCIFRVRGNSDEEAVRLANNCDFALSSCVFAGVPQRSCTVKRAFCSHERRTFVCR
jgi:succinate-semialdehyde dehydrogenase/glutarate-semialdehyde dehydrogenase